MSRYFELMSGTDGRHFIESEGRLYEVEMPIIAFVAGSHVTTIAYVRPNTRLHRTLRRVSAWLKNRFTGLRR